MTHKRFYFTILLVVLGLGTYGLLLGLLYSVNAETRTLVAETAERRAQIREELSLKAFADDIRTNTNVLERVVVSKNGAVDFIEFLEKLGKDQGVTLAIASVKETEKDTFNELSLQISADGTWSQLMRIVELLEILPTAITFKSVDLQMIDAQAGTTVKKGKVVALSQWRLALELSAIKTK